MISVQGLSAGEVVFPKEDGGFSIVHLIPTKGEEEPNSSRKKGKNQGSRNLRGFHRCKGSQENGKVYSS